MTDFLLRHGWPLLASIAVKSLFVPALAGLAVLSLRRSSAAARHLVWRLALCGLLLMPLFSWMPAVWQVPLAPRALLVPTDAPVVTPSLPAPNAARSAPTAASPAPNLDGAGGQPQGVAPTPPESATGGRVRWPIWACAAWLAGCALTLLPTLIGLAGVELLARRSVPVPDGPLPELSATLAQELGVRTSVRLLTGAAGTPMTWGWLRPVILLPPGADGWPPGRLRAVLLHELAHIARADWPAQMASHLACALYWFNPLVWLAARAARLEGERACDDRVLLAGIPAPDYARHLLDVARSLRDPGLPTALPLVNAATLKVRLQIILDTARRRGEVARRATLIAVGLSLAFLVGQAVLRVEVRVPATLDASTPVAQGGFTLLAIQRNDGSGCYLDTHDDHGTFHHMIDRNAEDGIDGTELWVQPPRLPATSPAVLWNEYHAQAQTSTGIRIILPCGVADHGYSLGDRPPLVCVSIPPGYPNIYRYIDVTVMDKHGNRALWRLTNLPKMRHVLMTSTVTPAYMTCQGFTIKAHARRYFDEKHDIVANISCGLDVTATPARPLHQWEVVMGRPIMEWQSESAPDADDYSEELSSQMSLGPCGELGSPTPYAQDLRYMEINAQVHQYETYDEKVTFHNVVLKYVPHTGTPPFVLAASPQTITTPSGITVTLPVLSHNTQILYLGTTVGLTLNIQLPCPPILSSLPILPCAASIECR